MKLEKNDRYFNIAAYAVIAALIIVLGIFILINFTALWQWIKIRVILVIQLLEPLILGLVIAYLLDPIVTFYDKRWSCLHEGNKFHFGKRKPQKSKKRWPMRTVPTLLAFLTLLGILGLFILMIRMNVEQVAGDFSVVTIKESLSSYLAYFENMMTNVTQITNSLGIADKGQNIIERFYSWMNEWLLKFYREFTSSLLALSIRAMNGLLAFVVAFYLLQDKTLCLESCKACIKKLFKEKTAHQIIDFGNDIDGVLSGYIRGEVIDSVIIIILTSSALMLIQMDFAIIIGLISGIFNLIPYFGPIVGFGLAIFIGLLDPNPMKALYGAIAILIIQQIDGWFIVPKIVGDSVKLHPVVVLLAILIGGNLFGLLGMLLAVPVTAFIRLLIIRLFSTLSEK